VTPPLLERAGETGDLQRALAEANRGRGAALLIEGEAGIGKTALLDEARRAARALGGTVLTGVGSPLEGAVPFGLARQLLLPFAEAAQLHPQRGAAALAAPALGLDAGTSPPGPDAAFAAVHGLVWLVADLADARGPLLLCLDDLHWADPASLRSALALAARMSDLPALLLGAGRPAERLAELRAVARPVRPRRLTPDAVGTLLAAELGAEPAAAFAGAAHDETGGLPLQALALASALRREGIRPDEDQIARLRALGSSELAASVAARLGAASPSASALACAAAVGGHGRPLAEIALLAQVPGRAAAEAADELVAAGMLSPLASDGTVAFAHPTVAAAVLDGMAAGERTRLHARAAELASGAGDVERAAMHLLTAPGTADPAAVRVLCEAATTAMVRGAPDEAVTLLRRAVAEPPSEATRPAVLLTLGQAELLTADEQAVGRLAAAAAGLSDATARLRAGTLRGHALSFMGRFDESFEVMAAALASAGGADPEVVRMTQLERLFAMLTSRTAGSTARDEIAALRDEGSPVERALAAGLRALSDVLAGAPVQDVAGRARAAMQTIPVVALITPLQTCPALALLYADDTAPGEDWLHTNREAARRRGHVRVLQLSGTWLAVLATRDGRPHDAAEAALDTDVAGVETPSVSRLMLSAVRAEVALARGRLAEAAEAVAEPLEDHPLLAPLSFVSDFLVARARVRRAQGRPQEAVDLARTAGAQTDQWGAASPTTNGWRAHLAFALADCGRTDEARDVAAQEVAAARATSAPRPLAAALRALAYAADDPVTAGDALETARAGAPELEIARCEVLAGRLALGRGEADQARDLLRTAMDRAWRVGAEGVSDEARLALIGAGGRPRRRALQGAAALTPAEARTAKLVARGATNREAAEALFVTLGTVERHLTSAYRKLGVEGRERLATALGDAAADGG